MSQPYAVQLTGGVNLLDSPKKIRDDQVAYAKNLFPLVPGELAKRGGARLVSAIAESVVYPAFSVPPFESDILALIAGDYGPSPTESVVWLKSSLTSGIALHEPFKINKRPMVVPYQNRLYTLLGYPATYPAVVGYSSGGVLKLERFYFLGSNNNFPARVGGVYRSRMVWGDLGSGYEDYVVFSDPFLPNTIGNDVRAANGRAFRIGSATGDRVVAFVEMAMSHASVPGQSALLVLKEHSAWLINGEPNSSTDTGDMFGSMTVSRIQLDVGCASAETVKWTPYGLIWASHDEVWLFDIGSLPRPIGHNIRPALTRAPSTDKAQWHAAYFDGVYRLAVHGEGQGPIGKAANNQDGLAVSDQWWLDLRSGPPQAAEKAQWWGPMVFPQEANYPMAVEVRPGRAHKLLGLGSDPSDSSEFTLLEYDAPITFDSNSLTEDPQPPLARNFISTELRSKEYETQDPYTDKTYQKAEVKVFTDVPTRLSIKDQVEGGKRSVTTTKDFANTGFISGASVDGDPAYDEYQTIPVFPANRLVGKSHQLVISDSPGYVITSHNNQLAVSVVIAGVENTYLVSLTVGHYADLAALLTQIQTQLNAQAVTGVWTVSLSTRKVQIACTQTFRLLFQTFTGFTATQLQESRRLADTLGFVTTTNLGAALTLTATEEVYTKQSARIRFSDIVFWLLPMIRRP